MVPAPAHGVLMFSLAALVDATGVVRKLSAGQLILMDIPRSLPAESVSASQLTTDKRVSGTPHAHLIVRGRNKTMSFNSGSVI